MGTSKRTAGLTYDAAIVAAESAAQRATHPRRWAEGPRCLVTKEIGAGTGEEPLLIGKASVEQALIIVITRVAVA